MRYEEDRERVEAGTVPYDGTKLVKRQVKPVKWWGKQAQWEQEEVGRAGRRCVSA